MNYGTYINYKIKNKPGYFSICYKVFQKNTKTFWHCWCILYIKLLNIGFWFCVFFCIWGHRLKICFDPQIEIVRLPKIEHFLRSVNNFRIEDFLVLNGPLTSLKHPSGIIYTCIKCDAPISLYTFCSNSSFSHCQSHTLVCIISIVFWHPFFRTSVVYLAVCA